MKRAERAHYVAVGAMTGGGLSRRAKVRKCAKCRAWTFQGLESDWCAWGAITDLRPLDAMGELVALLGGLRTYSLIYAGGHYEINSRGELAIAARPPGSRVNEDIVAAHKCGVDIAGTIASNLPRARLAKPQPKNPPF